MADLRRRYYWGFFLPFSRVERRFDVPALGIVVIRARSTLFTDSGVVNT
jgi:hypothetical protein